jgi:hypothetical protein
MMLIWMAAQEYDVTTAGLAFIGFDEIENLLIEPRHAGQVFDKDANMAEGDIEFFGHVSPLLM